MFEFTVEPYPEMHTGFSYHKMNFAIKSAKSHWDSSIVCSYNVKIIFECGKAVELWRLGGKRVKREWISYE